MASHRKAVGPAGYTIHSTPGVLRPAKHRGTRLQSRQTRPRRAPVRISYLPGFEPKVQEEAAA